jgi:hypothetical protein
MNVLCLIRGQRPKRAKAYFDGNIFRAPCLRCERAMVKLPEQGKWVCADSALTADVASETRAPV